MTAKIKLNAASGGGSVSIVAPTSTTSNANVELKLPIADGGAEQVIKTDGSGNLSFGQAVTAKNLVTNGNMAVSQRGTSSTSVGILVDGFNVNFSGTDEAVTHAQVDVNSSDSGDNPFTKGITKALKLTNGNQTSGAGAADRVRFLTVMEARDIRNSGWNYTSTSSFITLSFYVKSSVSQNFYFRLTTADGTGQSYVMETGTLTANSWTRVTKTIPGNSNLQFDDNANHGLYIVIVPFRGTDNTGTRPLNAWAAFDTAAMYPDMTTTWYTTNDATFEVTGVQLEVGSSASAFALESYAENVAKCQRYLFKLEVGKDGGFNNFIVMSRYSTGGSGAPFGQVHFPVQMRSEPTFTYTGTALTQAGYAGNPSLYHSSKDMATLQGSTNASAGGVLYLRRGTSDDLDLFFSAEL